MTGKPPLRAVKDGETPPKKRAPAKPRARTVAQAAKLSKKTFLETVRNKLAATMDDPRSHPRDVIAAANKVLDIQAQLDALDPKKRPAEPRSAIANTPNDDWDQDAI